MTFMPQKFMYMETSLVDVFYLMMMNRGEVGNMGEGDPRGEREKED